MFQSEKVIRNIVSGLFCSLSFVVGFFYLLLFYRYIQHICNCLFLLEGGGEVLSRKGISRKGSLPSHTSASRCFPPTIVFSLFQYAPQHGARVPARAAGIFDLRGNSGNLYRHLCTILVILFNPPEASFINSVIGLFSRLG